MLKIYPRGGFLGYRVFIMLFASLLFLASHIHRKTCFTSFMLLPYEYLHHPDANIGNMNVNNRFQFLRNILKLLSFDFVQHSAFQGT
jgi:hypothetical protein